MSRFYILLFICIYHNQVQMWYLVIKWNAHLLTLWQVLTGPAMLPQYMAFWTSDCAYLQTGLPNDVHSLCWSCWSKRFCSSPLVLPVSWQFLTQGEVPTPPNLSWGTKRLYSLKHCPVLYLLVYLCWKYFLWGYQCNLKNFHDLWIGILIFD